MHMPHCTKMTMQLFRYTIVRVVYSIKWVAHTCYTNCVCVLVCVTVWVCERECECECECVRACARVCEVVCVCARARACARVNAVVGVSPIGWRTPQLSSGRTPANF